MPKRIQRSRAAGWQMPKGAVYVGRPTIWGNPFVCDDPAKAVEAFERYTHGGTQQFEMGPGALQFAGDAHQYALHWAYPDYVKEHIGELRGKDLVCWCRLDQPCHADVLLKLANEPKD